MHRLNKIEPAVWSIYLSTFFSFLFALYKLPLSLPMTWLQHFLLHHHCHNMEARSMERKQTSTEKVNKDSTVEDDEDEEEEDESGGGGVEEDEKKKKKKGTCVSVSGRRGSSGGGRVFPPCCQTESCGADLTFAKRYHRRHKVCELHSKAPVVMVAGLRQRFCQQCSRFHELAEFDEAKRSCRRRLEKHNERRRKSSAGTCNEGSSTITTGINGQHHHSESYCKNNAAGDWRKIQMNMTRSSGHKFFHLR